MTREIDLNADMGEGFGPWPMGNDTALLDIVTSANVACGFHAGDPDVMARTMRRAHDRGVGLGAHPGFSDLQGFGRRRITLSDGELANLVAYQVGAAQAMARMAGTRLRHLKLHGALANMASEDADMARVCYEAALTVQPDLTIMVLAATAMETAARSIGCAYANEIFADRAYRDDARLVDRGQPGAVLHDPEAAAQRIVAMLEAGAIITGSGKHIRCRIDTICVHGDGPTALAIAGTLRHRLETAGWTLAPL